MSDHGHEWTTPSNVQTPPALCPDAKHKNPNAPLKYCLARVFPSTTVFTASRCDGLAISDRCTILPLEVGRLKLVPKWYLTSPLPVYSPCAGHQREEMCAQTTASHYQMTNFSLLTYAFQPDQI